MQRGYTSPMSAPYRWVTPPADYPGSRYLPSNRVLEHHLVWWQKTGNLVPSGWVIHHRDNCGMNNAFENLELLPTGEHTQHHNPKEPDLVVPCGYCGAQLVRESRIVRAKLKQGQQGFYCSSEHAALSQNKGTKTHGTSSGYAKGCRCAECCTYHATRAKRYREKRKQQSTTDTDFSGA